MNQIRISLAAAAILMVAFASQTFANGRPSSSHRSNSHASSYRSNSHGSHANYNNGRSFNHNYHTTHGTRFQHGYFYRGHSHSHWTYQRYDSRYGCVCYYDPCCSCWYYWCEPASCYYPVTYCPYPTYCGSGGCTSGVAGRQFGPSQGPVGPGRNGPGSNGPGPVNGSQGPAGPGPNGPAAINGPQGDGAPPIPAPMPPAGRN